MLKNILNWEAWRKEFENFCKTGRLHALTKKTISLSNFLKAVFQKFYLVHSWILCPIWPYKDTGKNEPKRDLPVRREELSGLSTSGKISLAVFSKNNKIFVSFPNCCRCCCCFIVIVVVLLLVFWRRKTLLALFGLIFSWNIHLW